VTCVPRKWPNFSGRPVQQAIETNPSQAKTGYYETIGYRPTVLIPRSDVFLLGFVSNSPGTGTPSGPNADSVQSRARLRNCFRCSSVRALTAHRRAISCVCVIFIDSGHGASLPFAGALLVSQPSISAERGPGTMAAAPCAYSPSIARRKRNAYCWPTSCLKLKNEAPAVGREPSGGRRLSIGCSRKKRTRALEKPRVGGERNTQLRAIASPRDGVRSSYIA
jgi:hypothetical protein